MTNPKRPRDPNQLAKLIVGIATGEVEDINPDADKDPAAIARGRKGGAKGGKLRMEALTESQRTELGKRAASARWEKGTPPHGDVPVKGQLNKRS